MKEAFPLSWPDGWVRTRPQDRKKQSSWKKSASFYQDALTKELNRMGVTSFVLSSNVPLNVRGQMTAGVEPLDPGVAAYFSRAIEEDFKWQDALGIHDPAPTADQINDAFKRLARQYHPDSGGDPEMYLAVVKHRDNALRYINRKTDQNFAFVIACDVFKEVRHNIEAICMTIKAIRQIERCGTSSLLERAFKGFSALPENVPVKGVENVSVKTAT
jgi:hypothetical protein